MRFKISEFEQHFTESNLEKGLRLLRRSKPVLHERSGNHMGYQVGGHLVSLHQKDLEVNHCFCDCLRKFCPHAAALMFFFLERSLGGQQSVRIRRKKQAAGSAAGFNLVFSGLKNYWKELSQQESARKLHARFLAKLNDVSSKGAFSADMAVIAAISLAGRAAVTNDAMRALTSKLILRHFADSSRADETILYNCLLETLRTSDRAASNQFSAVLPVYLVLTSNMFHLEEIRAALEKRNQKKFHADIFDELLVARSMVFFRCSQVQGGEVKLLRNSQPENFVALARLYFAAQKIEEAWEVMEELRKQMRATALGYFDFLVYLVNLSEALRDTRRQIGYLEELILHSPYLSASLARKYFTALPTLSRRERMNALMAQVIATKAEGAVDKVFVLANVSGQPELFMQICDRQKVKFNMLHELLINKSVQNSPSQIAYYFERFKEALVQTDFYQARIQLLEMGAAFLEKIDTVESIRCSAEVLNYISDYPMLSNLQAIWIALTDTKTALLRS